MPVVVEGDKKAVKIVLSVFEGVYFQQSLVVLAIAKYCGKHYEVNWNKCTNIHDLTIPPS